MGTVLTMCSRAEPTPQELNPLPAPEATRERKRFNPFFQPNIQNQVEVRLHERYKFVSNYDDRFMGRCSVLEEMETGNLYLYKEIESKSDAACRETVEKLKNKKQQQEHYEGVLRVIEVFGKRVDGLLKDVNKVVIIMEYPLVSIKRQFNNRMLNKIDFEINEIKNFIFATIKAYAALEKSGCSNEKVRMAHIFMGLHLKESVVKVIDSDLLPVPSNFVSMTNKGNSKPENHDIYLAPEEFHALVEGATEPPAQGRGKAAVFSLGATILDICIMAPIYEIYHYHRNFMGRQQLKGLINIARKRHGALVYKLLISMLEFDPQKRPSFAELQIIIAKPLSQSEVSGSMLRLSTMKDENSKYLLGTRHSGKYGKLSQASIMSHSIAERAFCRGGESVQEEQQEELIHMHEKYTNGSQYIGQKKRDLKHGRGKYIFRDRSYYEGWWRDDLMHGEGQLFFPNGKLEYQGEWAYDEPSGWGVLYAAADSTHQSAWTRYEGEMKNGEMHGHGKLYFIDQTVYDGQLHNGKIFGRGCRISKEGEMLEREWPLMDVHTFLNYDHGRSQVRLSQKGRQY